MLELRNLDDLGIALDAPYKGIFDGSSELAGDAEERLRRQMLIPEEQNEMIEQRAPKPRGRLFVHRPPEIDAVDLRAERASDRIDADRVKSRQSGRSYHPCEGTVREAGLCRKRS